MVSPLRAKHLYLVIRTGTAARRKRADLFDLFRIEPPAAGRARIDDDAGDAAVVAAVHQIATARAGVIPFRQLNRLPAVQPRKIFFRNHIRSRRGSFQIGPVEPDTFTGGTAINGVAAHIEQVEETFASGTYGTFRRLQDIVDRKVIAHGSGHVSRFTAPGT